MAYLEDGHDPALDRPTLTIPKPKLHAQPRTPTERTENAIRREFAEVRSRLKHLRTQLADLERRLEWAPVPGMFHVYKVLRAQKTRLEAREKVLAPLDRELLRRRVLNPPVVRPLVIVKKARKNAAQRERLAWVAGWRHRLTILEKNGRL